MQFIAMIAIVLRWIDFSECHNMVAMAIYEREKLDLVS
jgi:hypothetical protein